MNTFMDKLKKLLPQKKTRRAKPGMHKRPGSGRMRGSAMYRFRLWQRASRLRMMKVRTHVSGVSKKMGLPAWLPYALCAAGAVCLMTGIALVIWQPWAQQPPEAVQADAQVQPSAAGLIRPEATEASALESALQEVFDQVPEFIQLGTEHPIVQSIQERLVELGYLAADEPSNLYNEQIAEAIATFQLKNELEQTGTLDTAGIEYLFSEEAKIYTLTVGDRSTDVHELQWRLYELGYLDDEPDGIFGSDTEAAVKRFQQRNYIIVDGKVGSQTREMLYSSDVVANLYTIGEESDEIKQYQQKLKTLGYLYTEPDGKFGKDTVAAVKRFQESAGLIVDGYIGPQTKNLLLSGDAPGNALAIGVEGEDVERIQKRLISLGYLNTAATGYFGSATDAAVRSFQKTNGLMVDGKVGSVTMSKLSSSSARTASGAAAGTSSAEYSAVSRFLAVARSKLGCKYVWGAKGPNRFDCSGFVYWCLNQSGVTQSYMTSAAWAKSSKYTKITSMSKIQRGDIIVYRGHVGIATSSSTMIDASNSNGKVVERSFASNYWQRNFVCAFRVF